MARSAHRASSEVLPAARSATAPVPRAATAGADRAGSGGHPVRLDIQGLRALAVSLVVLSHAGIRRVAGGYIGVDIFFVISGFLITSLLLRELAADGRLSVRRFYARRALRLLPASTLVGAATLAGAWLYLSKVRFDEYAGDALSSTFYAVNFRLAASGTDYLNADSPPSPFQHFWSLAVEEQFYLVWPLLLVLSWTLARRFAGGRTGWVAVPLAAVCAASFVVNIRLTGSSASWAYFGSQGRLWELGAGALLALSAGRLTRVPGWLSAPMTWVGLIALVAAALLFDNSTPFPGRAALVPVLGTVLVLAGGCSPSRFGAGPLLSMRPAVRLGGLSYSWYLWHWPLIVILPSALDREPSSGLGLSCAAIALVAARLTVALVENPVRFHRALRGRPGRALGLGLGLSAGAAALALVAAAFPPPISSGVPAPGLMGALAAAPDPQARLTQLLRAPNESLPGNLATGLTEIKDVRSAVYRDGCHLGYTTTAVPPCVYGDPSARKTVVLFGDSHAAQWFPALDRLARDNHWKLVSLTKASCKVAEVTTINGAGPYTSCDQWRAKALARIEDLRPALVIATSSDVSDLFRPAGDPVRQWTDGFTSTFRALRKSGAEVLTLLDNPWPKGDAVDCAGTYPLELHRCASTVGSAVRDPDKRTEITDAAAAAGASVVDPRPWLCAPTGTCPVVVGDTFVYRDDSHLADAYVEAVAPLLGNAITALYGDDLSRHPVHRAG